MSNYHLLGLVAALLAGCATTPATVVPPALTCPVPPALAHACASPQTLSTGITFGELLLAYQADRAGLARCAARQADLVQLVAACGAATSAFDARLVR